MFFTFQAVLAFARRENLELFPLPRVRVKGRSRRRTNFGAILNRKCSAT